MTFRSAAGFFLGFAAYSLGQTPPVDPSVFSKSMAVLDLVSLRDNQPDSASAEGLRRNLAGGGFHVISREATAKKLAEFGTSLAQPCNNSQCAFDAGNYLQSDFVLYGTSSSIERIRAVTLKLLYVPAGHVVWTWVGEIPVLGAGEDSDGWQKPYRALAEAARNGELELRPPRESKSLAVLDVSENFYSSRILSERVQTRMAGLTDYQPMSASELSELLAALGINKYALGPSPANMIGLGQRLGASALLYARAYREGDRYLCRLALYDVERKRVVLDFPAQPTRDFGRLLEYENEFFSRLSAREGDPGPVGREGEGTLTDSAQGSTGKSNLGLWISLGLLGIGGGLAAFWLESLKKK